MHDRLRVPDAHFRLLFERSPAPYLVLLPDEGFTIVEVNDAYLRATNTQREQLLGQRLFEAFPDNPDDLTATGTANLRASLERALASKAPDTMAFQRYDVPCPQGGFDERYWSPVNVPVLSDGGEVLYLIHRVEDVTEFVRLVESRQHERDRTQTLQAQKDELAIDLLRRSEELNAANAELRQKNEALRQSQARLSENECVEFIIDVTERKHAEQSVRANEARFRALVNASSDLIYRMSPDGREMRELDDRGFLVDTPIAGDTWLEEYIHPDDRSQVMESVQEAIRAKGTFEMEHRVRRADGRLGWTHSRAVPLLDDQGEISEWIGAASDVTKRKRAEELLRENDRRKDEFLAMLAHELRNPLGAIANTVKLLERRTPEAGGSRRYLDILNRQTEMLRGLVDDLLDVSRITRGLVELKQERVDLAAVADRALESVQALMDDKRHEVSATLPRKALMVEGDPVRLEQILVNLLTNAAKYTDPGGRIDLCLERKDQRAELRVRDTGIGMTPDVIERIFALFGQAERGLARSEGGLGIGLTIVKRLVELHGGQIEARSAGLGQGAEFVVTLPSAEAAEVVTGLGPEEPVVAVRSKRVLVVEDSKDIAETLALLLEDSGHEVALAQDGLEALAKAEALDPEVILLDIGLPGMDGYEVAQRLRQNPRMQNVRIAALSGYGQAEDVARAHSAGFDAHFTKPVDLEALEVFVNAVQPHARR